MLFFPILCTSSSSLLVIFMPFYSLDLLKIIVKILLDIGVMSVINFYILFISLPPTFKLYSIITTTIIGIDKFLLYCIFFIFLFLNSTFYNSLFIPTLFISTIKEPI